MDGKRQLYLISRHIAPSFPGGDKAGQGGGVYKGGSISCAWLDELISHPPQLTVDIEETSEEETERNFLLLSVAYAANIGGTGVITGSDTPTKALSGLLPNRFPSKPGCAGHSHPKVRRRHRTHFCLLDGLCHSCHVGTYHLILLAV